MEVINKNYLKSILTILFLLLLLPNQVSASTSYLKGEFDIIGGQADYNIPILTAPGRVGHIPSLQLAYSSDRSNGVLGVGWHLRGLSSIYRCGKDLAIDGNWGGVNFDEQDQYCIDGQRLIAISGKPGQDLTEYRTRTNDYRKIVSFGSLGSGPEHFKVWSKDGQVYEYGLSQDSRAELSEKPDAYKWALNAVFDITKKNKISFNYFKDVLNGIHRIQNISYAGGEVEFTYEERDDTSFSYFAGSKLNKNYRMKSISSKTSKGSEVATYNLAYSYSAGTGRSLIKEIKQCANGECRKEVTFAWQSQARPIFKNDEKILHSRSRNGRVKFYDVERDGELEIFTLSSDKKTVVQNNDSKNIIPGIRLSNEPRCDDFAVADWDANNSPSYRAICAGTSNGKFFAYPNGDGTYLPFYTIKAKGYDWAKEDKFPADKDGDGRYIIEPSCIECAFYDINGDGLNNEYLKVSNDGLSYYKNDALIQNIYPKGYSSNKLIKVIDFNNDGYLDILAATSTTFIVYYFDGNVFVSVSPPLSVDYKKTKHHVSKTCYYGKQQDHSRDCSYDYYSYSLYGSEVADVNSDGFSDIVYNNKVYINRGGLFDSSNSFSSAYEPPSLVKDVIDIIDVNSDGWPDNLSGTDIKRTESFAQDKIKLITEHGISYEITYAPLTSDVHQQKEYYEFPIVNTTPTLYVVSQFTGKPQGYDPVTTSFKYYGAKSHLKGEGFLGFEQIDRIREGVNIEKTVTKFEQLDPILAGKVKEKATYKNEKLYLTNNYQYSKKKYKGVSSNYYSVHLDNKTQISFDKFNRIEKKTETTLTYDDFGNILTKEEKLTSGLPGVGAFSKSYVNEYLSSGNKQNSTIIDVTNPLNSSIVNNYDSFQLMCTSDGTKYIKSTDKVVLIHAAVTIPLIIEGSNEYYKLVFNDATNSNADFVTVSEAEFYSANASPCTDYVVVEHSDDGTLELTKVNKVTTQLITESGNNYWKVSAPVKTIQAINDNSNGLNRVIVKTFNYTPNGLLSLEVLKPEQYELGDANYGNVSKQVSTSYTYDDYGNVLTEQVSGTGAAARTTTFAYDDAEIFPLFTKNAKGHKTIFGYDDRFGFVTKSVSPVKGRTTSWRYDNFGRVLNENPPGSADNTAYEYQLGSACTERTSKTASCVIASIANGKGGVYQTITQFDFAGREIRAMHQAFDGRWVYRDTQWDMDGRKVSVTRPSFKRPDAMKTPLPTVYFGYDERDREVSKIEPSAGGEPAKFLTQYDGLKTVQIDAKGNKKSIIYNLLGHITATTEPMGASQSYVNYPDGSLKETQDSAGNVTRIRYDNLGRRTYLDDPDMGRWKYDYNIFGELTDKKDANGVTTRISYDTLGRKISERQADQTSSWVYDTKVAGLLSSFNGNDNQREFYYDSAGQVAEVRITAKGLQLSTRYTYDGLERIASEVRPNGLKLEYLYNPYGYHAAVRSPKDFADDVLKSPSFKADIQKLIDDALAQAQLHLNKAEAYAAKEHFFDQKVSEYAGREIDLHNLDSQSIQLLKDANHYKKYCAENGECYLQATSWVLLHGAVTIPIDIDLEQYFKLTSRESGIEPGVKLFDSSVYEVSAQEFHSRNFGEAENWLLSDFDRNGTLDLVDSDVNSTSVDYDNQGGIYTAEELSLAAQAAATQYQYNYQLAEQLINFAEQAGEIAGLYCDDANRLAGNNLTQRKSCTNDQQVSQVDHLQTVFTQIELDEAKADKRYVFYWQRQATDAYDHTLAETLGNGLVNSYVHNQATGRPSVIATHLSSAVVSQRNHLNMEAGKNIRYLRYQYDVHNNVTQRDDLELGIFDVFEYDALDRLTASRAILDRADRHGLNNSDFNRRFDYDYDALGNLKGKTDIGAYEYRGAGPHAVSKAKGITFTYDKVGNLLKGETETTDAAGTAKKVVERSLEWSSFNKPTKITRNGHTVEFAYDANHSRYYRKDSSGEETFYFDKLYERVKDVNSGEVQHKQYIYADGKLIALNIEQYDSANKFKDRQIRYLHYDALGSVDLITDGYGLVVERRSFDPWGKARKLQWRDINDASTLLQFTLTNRGFTGHEHLKEVGMIHMNGRVYDQELGRFLSADPIVQSPYMTDSFNRYSYVTNNPLKYTDPTGFIQTETGDNDGSSYADHRGNVHEGTKNGRDKARKDGNDAPDNRFTIEEAINSIKDPEERKWIQAIIDNPNFSADSRVPTVKFKGLWEKTYTYDISYLSKPVTLFGIPVSFSYPRYINPTVALGAGFPGSTPMSGNTPFSASLDMDGQMVSHTYMKTDVIETKTITKTRRVYYHDLDFDGDGSLDRIPNSIETRVEYKSRIRDSYHEWKTRKTDKVRSSASLPGW